MAETRNPALRDLKGLGSRQPGPSIGRARTNGIFNNAANDLALSGNRN